MTPSSSKRQLERERLTPNATGIVMAMVGLPARGKSFISRKVERFLQWRGIATRTFNVGRYRRSAVAPGLSGRSEFFDATNQTALAAREEAATAALNDSLAFLDGGGKIAILDATNSTVKRRRSLVQQVSAHDQPYAVIFVEAICDDREVLDMNMRGKVRNSPDFQDMEHESGLADLRLRIAKYDEVYETVQDDEGPSIKLYNLSSKVMANHCYGRIAKSLLPYLMAIHIGARPIWLVRAGAGQGNPQSPSGSDRLSVLSTAGRSFAASLAEFVQSRSGEYWRAAGKPREPAHVLTSTMPRAVASVVDTTPEFEQTSALNPIDKGAITVGCWDVECPSDVPPWSEVESRHQEFFQQWRRDPLRTRFPGGESYMDVNNRLEGLLIEVEMCTRPVLIVSHVTVLQLLVAYFKGLPIEEAWSLPFPKNTVMQVIPTMGGGFVVDEHPLTGGAPASGKRPSAGVSPGSPEGLPAPTAGSSDGFATKRVRLDSDE